MIFILSVALLQCSLVAADETGNQLGKIKILSKPLEMFFYNRVLEKFIVLTVFEAMNGTMFTFANVAPD